MRLKCDTETLVFLGPDRDSRPPVDAKLANIRPLGNKSLTAINASKLARWNIAAESNPSFKLSFHSRGSVPRCKEFVWCTRYERGAYDIVR